MSEGPQVKRRAEWLHRHLAGRTVLGCKTTRPALAEFADRIPSGCVNRVFCKGKHIVMDFGQAGYLHNRLLMRGRWRREPGEFLFLPAEVWLSLYVDGQSLNNVNGQILRPLDQTALDTLLAGLGPDMMTQPFPHEAFRRALAGCRKPVAEALLDQAVVCGIGNVAKSEALYSARIDPRRPATALTPEELQRLGLAVHAVMWESYRRGGRWTHRVYRKQAQPCPRCGGTIRLLRLAPSRRSTYYCTSCQKGTAPEQAELLPADTCAPPGRTKPVVETQRGGRHRQ